MRLRPSLQRSRTPMLPLQRAMTTQPEAAVVVALVDTLIPKDDVGPGGVEVGVPTFIDRADEVIA